MGFKIEIVLISIAVFLCGCILLVTVLKNEEPDTIAVISYENETSVSQTAVIDTYEQTDTEVVNTQLSSDKININTATKEELMQLDGIGEVISSRIIEYRETNKFTSISDIMNVKGIGEKTFEAIKNKIIIQ